MDLRQATQQDEPQDQRRQPHIMQIVTTEHYNLQAARSLAVADANGRAALFLGTVSGTLIALAFVGNVTHMGAQLGTAFFVFAFVLFPPPRVPRAGYLR
jgi:hypothetical protein